MALNLLTQAHSDKSLNDAKQQYSPYTQQVLGQTDILEADI